MLANTEAACDPLKAEGVTAALCRLCIELCESRDHAGVASLISEARHHKHQETGCHGEINIGG